MATFRQRTKGGTWDYRIVDNNKIIDTNFFKYSPFKDKSLLPQTFIISTINIITGFAIYAKQRIFKIEEDSIHFSPNRTNINESE